MVELHKADVEVDKRALLGGKKRPMVVACIPAFKEEATIAKVVLYARSYADHVLVCDDGSPDLTGRIAEELGALVVRHEKNLGKGKAVKTLLRQAVKFKPDVVVLLDADGQHDPSEIPTLVKPIEDGQADLVVGSRYLNGRNAVPFYRKVGLTVIDRWLRRGSNTNVKDTQSGYRAISGKVLEALSAFDSKGYGVESEMLTLAQKNGLRVVEVPVNVTYAGLPNTSKKSPVRQGGELLQTLLRLFVEERPLSLLGIPGAILIVVGLFSTINLVLLFNTTSYFSMPMALIAFGGTTAGLVLLVSSLILWALNRSNTKGD